MTAAALATEVTRVVIGDFQQKLLMAAMQRNDEAEALGLIEHLRSSGHEIVVRDEVG